LFVAAIASAFARAAAQGGAAPGSAVTTQNARPANAPPLVPVKLTVDGSNFRIAPPYVPDPAFTAKPNVPKGRVIRFTMNSAESKIFPTAPIARGGGAGARGGGQGQPGQAPQPGGAAAGSAEPPQQQTFERKVVVYVPAGYVAGTPAPFIVIQDERWYIPEDAPPNQDGTPRTICPLSRRCSTT